MSKRNLHFRVDPHIVEDLGVNLYTTLPRVLVEFLANAYDADSPEVRVTADIGAIQKARTIMRQAHRLELEKAKTQQERDKVAPLERRTLPAKLQIAIDDDGHGMSLDDMQQKFLVIGRRRRDDEKKFRTPGGRLVMGRKGLGKLAAFGVAHRVEITSRKKGESSATRITLDYDTLRDKKRAEDVPVEAEVLTDGGRIKKHGTRVVMSSLVFESVSNEEETIRNVIGSTFAMIDSQDFVVRLNKTNVDPPKRLFVYAYPPGKARNDLVAAEVTTDAGQVLKFDYRIRFTGKGKQLDSHERGVRVYAHGRLAAMPDLLQIRTGMHGYQNTHYLDGKVIADFIDEQPIDYIATDRQSLRWETPLLAPIRKFLQDKMEAAITAYQKKKEEDIDKEVKEDEFTRTTIEASRLPKHRKRSAYKIAAAIAVGKGDETQDAFYKKALPILVKGLGQGDILATVAALAEQGTSDLHKLIAVLSKLTAQEFDEFSTIIHGRLDGIKALEQLYKRVEFNAPNNEDELHQLFKKNPWLIDPTFTQFLTSNTTENELNLRLSKELEVDEHPPKDYDKNMSDEQEPLKANKRPDLVFLLSSASLRRLVIVELKAPNTPMHVDHLTQLEGYMRRAEEWLEQQQGEKAEYKVEGYLIGSFGRPESKAEKQKALKYQIDKHQDKSTWRVFDIGEILERTKRAHEEILAIYDNAAKAAEAAEKAEATTQATRR